MKYTAIITALLIGFSTAFAATENAELLALKAERLSVLELIKDKNKQLIGSEFRLKRMASEKKPTKITQSNMNLTKKSIKLIQAELKRLKSMNRTLTAKILKEEKSSK